MFGVITMKNNGKLFLVLAMTAGFVIGSLPAFAHHGNGYFLRRLEILYVKGNCE